MTNLPTYTIVYPNGEPINSLKPEDKNTVMKISEYLVNKGASKVGVLSEPGNHIKMVIYL